MLFDVVSLSFVMIIRIDEIVSMSIQIGENIDLNGRYKTGSFIGIVIA